MQSPSSAASIGNFFLQLGRKEDSPIDQMKLQKLLFYAHAWYLAYNSKPLFDEDFEAWPWGPVVSDIYRQTKNFRGNPIDKSFQLLKLQNSQNNCLLWHYVVPQEISETTELAVFLKEVWDFYKKYTGIQLSNSTHEPGEPWTIIKDQQID